MGEIAGTTVLVVEDDVDAAETLRIVLEDEKCAVIQAESAEEGLEKARSGRPDVILLDIMMPSGTEGFHFVWNLRRDEEEEVRGIPIIVLTAVHDKTKLRFYPNESDPEYGPGEFLPVQAFLDKPASSEQVVSKIAEVLAEKASASQGGPGV